MSTKDTHVWRFFKAGGVFQVALRDGNDIARIGELDQKLWTALSCPTKGLELDQRTLELIDTDGDGKVRQPEIVHACQWICRALNDADGLLRDEDTLPLARLNAGNDLGKSLIASAKRILSGLGKGDAENISLADVGDTQKIFAGTRFNADGIVTVGTADDAAIKTVIADILACYPTKADRSGDPGADADMISAFCAAVATEAEWIAEGHRTKDTLPLGEATDDAYALVQKLSGKIADYFTRSGILRFDPEAAAAVNAQDAQLKEILTADCTAADPKLAELPLARISPEAGLALDTAFNPAWAADMAQLQAQVIVPLLGKKETLTKEVWDSLCAKFAPYAAWLAAKPQTPVAALSIERISELVALAPEKALLDLVAQDLALKPEYDCIQDVERLLRYHRYLHSVLINFVNFRAFYRTDEEAAFQCGHLFINQRECELCVNVYDEAKHAALASMSYFYLLYCKCTRAGEAPRSIVAAVTAGDSDSLIVGRNGIFYDRQGRDWDATVTRIVENPISISQAFWLPYKRAMKWINEQIAKHAAAADSKVSTNLQSDAATAQDPKKKIDVGTVAALGVAFGALTAAFGALLSFFVGLGAWLPLGIVGIILAISLPSMVLAWMKLRMRNFAPLLDANGWAINSNAIVNIVLGGRLTQAAKLPKNSKKDLVDPYAAKSHWKAWFVTGVLIVLVACGVAWHKGMFDKKQPEPAPVAEQAAASTTPKAPSAGTEAK